MFSSYFLRTSYDTCIRCDSKLLSGVSFVGHGYPDSNLESPCTSSEEMHEGTLSALFSSEVDSNSITHFRDALTRLQDGHKPIHNYLALNYHCRSRNSVVGIANGYGLEN
jgi:hypothetical protein